jgi:hypothetical protein
MTGYVLRSLRDGEALPDEVRHALNVSYRVGIAHHLRVMAGFYHVHDLLARTGVPWLLVKGPVLAELVYGDPGLRPYADIDVIVRAGDLPSVARVMETSGSLPLDRNWPLMLRMRAGEVHLELPQHVELDLHWHLLFGSEQRRAFPIAMEELFERARPVQVRGATVWTTDPVDTLLHLCVHGAVEGGDQLIWLKDIERVIAVDVPDWDEVVRRATVGRIGLPVVAMLGRARQTLRAEVPEEVLAALCPTRAFRALLGKLDERFPVSTSNGRGSPATLVTRACRADLPATFAELGRGVGRRLGRFARMGTWSRDVAGNDPRHPGSLRHPAGDEWDRQAFMDLLEGMRS